MAILFVGCGQDSRQSRLASAGKWARIVSKMTEKIGGGAAQFGTDYIFFRRTATLNWWFFCSPIAQIDRDWYAALMLNRLMFIYFIQKKGFLDDDPNYLENRLRQTQSRFGKDQFQRKFYRHFLRRLFAEGLSTPPQERAPALRAIIGRVPYLNGGLFDLHDIEKAHEAIAIPDAAFENLFAFFAQYQWHLDSRPSATGRDINPDVIGYIFEKYINDRAAMGAYYTQEDITGYIARNTIIPHLLRRAEQKCANAFDARAGIWRLLREHPNAYIHPAVRHGCDIGDDELPANIRRGLDAMRRSY